MALRLTVKPEAWALKKPFVISRGTTTATNVIVVELSDGQYIGRGECWPSRRYGHTVESVVKELAAYRTLIEDDMTREDLQKRLSKGPARNAVDCAMWDLEAKRAGKTVWELCGLDPLQAVLTTMTVGLGTPEEMAKAAAEYKDWPILKLKLGAAGDLDRVEAVRQAAPAARLAVDVNEGWTLEKLEQYVEPMAKFGVELLEQPLSAAEDDGLLNFKSPIPLAADESCHDVRSLDRVVGKYQVINIKLDKSGGLTEALHLVAAARERNLGLMVGCMMGTSLAMAPGFVVASQCQFVDLDAPMANTTDREHAMRYHHGRLELFTQKLWG
jgi:L-alanine-DL-glutamate epimerase-like enolase superfamily enzyme